MPHSLPTPLWSPLFCPTPFKYTRQSQSPPPHQKFTKRFEILLSKAHQAVSFEEPSLVAAVVVLGPAEAIVSSLLSIHFPLVDLEVQKRIEKRQSYEDGKCSFHGIDETTLTTAMHSFVSCWDADKWTLLKTKKISDRPATVFELRFVFSFFSI